ncbi:MAG: helix-turn-helix transcriptional regulator [Clostridia bacterium]|nr:helix-turn-helix transcriptional regulator [Clostridia bacterium]
MNRLRELRKKNGLSQARVAIDMNISRESLSYYENERRQPSIPLLKAFSRYYRVSIDYIVDNDCTKPFDPVELTKKDWKKNY